MTLIARKTRCPRCGHDPVGDADFLKKLAAHQQAAQPAVAVPSPAVGERHWNTPGSSHPERLFAEWLNDQRMKDVSQVFHEIARKYSEALNSSPAWIPVNERLPEKNVEVLILFGNACSIAATGQYTGSKHDSPDGWCYPSENGPTGIGDDHQDWTVTHWMPLPIPPNEAVR